MNRSLSKCKYIVDIFGLRAICHLTGNERQVILDKIANGEVRLLSKTWTEFESLFPGHVGVFDKKKLAKISMKDVYEVRAAAVLEGMNSGFLDRSYDDNTDLYTASVGLVEGYTVISGPDKIDFYKGVKNCKCAEVSEIL